MLSESDIEAKLSELCAGDGLYVRGHAVKAGRAWEVILKAPELKSWEAYCAHSSDPAAQFALVQSMVVWAASDIIATSGTPRDAFTTIRARFVGAAEAICNSHPFQQFVGLQAESLEK